MGATGYYGKHDVRIEDVKVPDVRPDQNLTDVEWCGVCGSDLREYKYTSGASGEHSHHTFKCDNNQSLTE